MPPTARMPAYQSGLSAVAGPPRIPPWLAPRNVMPAGRIIDRPWSVLERVVGGEARTGSPAAAPAAGSRGDLVGGGPAGCGTARGPRTPRARSGCPRRDMPMKSSAQKPTPTACTERADVQDLGPAARAGRGRRRRRVPGPAGHVGTTQVKGASIVPLRGRDPVGITLVVEHRAGTTVAGQVLRHLEGALDDPHRAVSSIECDF